MNRFIAIFVFMVSFVEYSGAQKVPEGYLLQYSQNFSNSKSLLDFYFSNSEDWGLFNNRGDFYMQISADNSGLNDSIPENLAVLNYKIFGDFILEANIFTEPDSLGTTEIHLLLGLKSTQQFYHIKIAQHNDNTEHGIYVVKRGIQKELENTAIKTFTWEKSKWHTIRLERNIVQRTITVFADDMSAPVFSVKDYELVMGYTGFAVTSGTCRFDNIKIWAPTFIPEKLQEFNSPD